MNLFSYWTPLKVDDCTKIKGATSGTGETDYGQVKIAALSKGKLVGISLGDY